MNITYKHDQLKLRNEKNLMNVTISYMSLRAWRSKVQKRKHVNSPQR